MKNLFRTISLGLAMLWMLSVLCVAAAAAPVVANSETFEGRALLVHVPPSLPAEGARALVIVLHGGLGNAERIESGRSESGLRMDAVADKNGFVVAYLNGTQAERLLGADKEAWNAGLCCGLPAKSNVDDVGYIRNVVAYLVTEYGLDPKRVFAIGHSNGAMMAARLACETDVLAGAVIISGPLNAAAATCRAMPGMRVLAIHGKADQNVPIGGGRGSKGISGVTFRSEEESARAFINAQATYTLVALDGVDHRLDHIDEALLQTQQNSIAQRAATFFGLERP